MSASDIILSSGDRRVARGELELSARKAASVLAEIGVGKGDVVALLARNDVHYFLLPEAVRYLGATVTPVNWHLTASEIEYILKDCGARVLVCHADLYTDALRSATRDMVVLLDETPQEIRTAYNIDAALGALKQGDRDFNAELEAAKPHDGEIGPPTPALFYTSGTTGRPKAVERKPIPLEAAQALMARTAFAFGLDGEAPRSVMTGPLYHSAPNAYALNVIRKGGYLALQAKFEAEELLGIIERDRITNLHMVPTMFQRMLALQEDVRDKYDLSSLRHVVHGAAPCPPDVKRRMIDWLGPVVHEYYAMTEVGIIACSSSQEWLDNPGTVGAPPSGVDIEIRQDDGEVCATGTPGNICIRHEATHAVAYKGAEEKTRDMRQGDFVVTGDIGYLNDNGFLFISDRKTDMILSGGVNIYPAEIESALAEHDQVRDSAVFGVPDPDFGEKVIAYVEAHDLDEASLRDFLEARIAKFKIPRVIQFTDQLPREDSGKVKKRHLRDLYLEKAGS